MKLLEFWVYLYLFKRCKNDIEKNKDFENEVEEMY